MPEDGEESANGDEEAPDTSRATVRTYIPQYQKEEWQEHADQMDMSLSEFVRTMTQAGRRGYLDVVDLDSDVFGGVEDLVEDTSDDDDASSGAESMEDVFTELVCDVIRAGGPIEYDMLAAAAQDHIENYLDDALNELQAEGRIIHSPGSGYVIDEDNGGDQR